VDRSRVKNAPYNPRTIDRDTISDAARATIKGVKAIQINNAVKVLQLFGPEIKVSEKGRLNIVKNELTGEWEVSSRTTDAEDGTLYKPVEFPKLIDDWRKLQTSDHFYYMCTKWSEDGDVHAYFSPYESPYDAYIAYMNALSDLRLRAGK
jgi:hypothetical protein